MKTYWVQVWEGICMVNLVQVEAVSEAEAESKVEVSPFQIVTVLVAPYKILNLGE